MHILTTEELKRIESTVADVEKATDGEIVTVIAGRSDGYAAPRLIASGLLAAALVVGASLLLPVTAESWLVVGQLAAWALLYAASSPAARWFVPREMMARAVHRAALVAFVEKGVHRTKDRTGVLLFISELERRVEILADEGIHARVGVTGWRAHVDTVIAGIHAGKAADGICTVLRAIGAELAKLVPATSMVNELGNAPIVQKQG